MVLHVHKSLTDKPSLIDIIDFFCYSSHRVIIWKNSHGQFSNCNFELFCEISKNQL